MAGLHAQSQGSLDGLEAGQRARLGTLGRVSGSSRRSLQHTGRFKIKPKRNAVSGQEWGGKARPWLSPGSWGLAQAEGARPGQGQRESRARPARRGCAAHSSGRSVLSISLSRAVCWEGEKSLRK